MDFFFWGVKWYQINSQNNETYFYFFCLSCLTLSRLSLSRLVSSLSLKLKNPTISFSLVLSLSSQTTPPAPSIQTFVRQGSMLDWVWLSLTATSTSSITDRLWLRVRTGGVRFQHKASLGTFLFPSIYSCNKAFFL